MADVDSSRWDQPVTVAYENTDTTSLYDMSVVLHVSPRFDMEHISFDIEILSPDSMRMRQGHRIGRRIRQGCGGAIPPPRTPES
ncbi:MAG: hypothetical protein BHV65_11745 [Alistipes sp. 58_9_plus]|nr:MAG: hypothetical protein BHV65_11745 [Alistipes sp. 58_9_plus]